MYISIHLFSMTTQTLIPKQFQVTKMFNLVILEVILEKIIRFSNRDNSQFFLRLKVIFITISCSNKHKKPYYLRKKL